MIDRGLPPNSKRAIELFNYVKLIQENDKNDDYKICEGIEIHATPFLFFNSRGSKNSCTHTLQLL